MFPPRPRNPPQTPPGYSPLREAGGYSKDRSLDLIKTRRNDVDTWEPNLAYTLRAGLFRPLCTNGLCTQIGDFGLLHVPHRGNVIHNVVEGALEIARGFNDITRIVQQMAARALSDRERRDFAVAALHVRYLQSERHVPVVPDQLLSARRDADFGNSLWLTYNVVQENLIAGGLQGHTASGRNSRTRAIRAIREDIRINVGLWNHAMTLLEH
jgi:Domain of unknown function (DUF932)